MKKLLSYSTYTLLLFIVSNLACFSEVKSNLSGYKIDSMYNYNFNTRSNLWELSGKQINKFDLNNNMIEFIDYGWNPTTNLWTKSYKFGYTLNGNVIQLITYKWDSSSNSFITGNTSYKFNYTLDFNGQNTEIITSKFSTATSSWLNDEKSICNYNSNQQKTEQIYYSWVDTSNSWINSSKMIYSYDINGVLTQRIKYQWNGTWVNYTKETYAYNIAGNQIEYQYFSWENNNWMASSKRNYIYNTSNQLSEEVTNTFLSSSNKWNIDFKFSYSYDVYGNILEQIYSSWNSILLSWVQSSKVVNYNSNKSISTTYKKELSPNVVLFPNPTIDFFVIKNCPENCYIALYDISGRKLIDKSYQENEQVVMTNYPRGLYTLKIDNCKQATSIKIIKH